MRRWWVLLVGAAVAAALCLAMGHAARLALNPDGVSYLDVATLLSTGGWSAAVQAYWSPLYPVLLAALRGLDPAGPVEWLRLVHGLDTGLVLLTIAVLVWTAWRLRSPAFGLVVLPLYLLAAGRLPRVEAVTPDILLGALLALAGAEVLCHGTRRWWWLGILGGLSYLAKTSNWLWLTVVIVAAWALVPTAAARRRVAGAAGVTWVLMLCWVVPMSLAAGGITLGSTGRLNLEWYIRQGDSRTPDTHTGNHQQYQITQMTEQVRAKVAAYPPSPWTYQPWGDPTAWDAGVVGGYTRSQAVTWWGRLLGDLKPMVRVWLFGVVVMVLLPLVVVTVRRGSLRQGLRDEPRGAFLAVAGAAAIAQFLVVHAEPRLIAPFVLLSGMGMARWLTRVLEAPDAARPRWVGLAALAPGWLWAVAFGVYIIEREGDHHRLRVRTLDATRLSLVQHAQLGHGGRLRIAVIGPASAVMDDAWLFGGQIVAQMVQPKAEAIELWSRPERVAAVDLMRRYHPDVIWIPMPDGELAMMPGR